MMRLLCSKSKTESDEQSLSPPREERRRIAGINVTLSWPSKDVSAQPKGVTFLLPGAMVSISEYNGIRDVILGQNHLVVSFYINVLWPIRNNHRQHATNAKNIFDELRSTYTQLPASYSIVGHSAGGKVALLLASIIDPMKISVVISLDPVDINPVEFSNEHGSNQPLDDDSSKKNNKIGDVIPIILTCTDGGLGIPTNHNADAIHQMHPRTTCYRHSHAGHMAYCDNGGGWAGKLMPDVGTKEGNEKAKESAHELIRKNIH